MIVAACLLGMTAVGSTMAAFVTKTSEHAVADISVKNVKVTAAGTKEGAFTVGKEGGVTPGDTIYCPLWVENSGSGYDIYVKVDLYKTWNKEGLDAASGMIDREKEDENWLLWYEDEEQLTLYYRYPLAATKKNNANRTTNFMEGLLFPPEMNNAYADASMNIEYKITAVQANNGEAAIAAEWGVFPVFDANGVLFSVYETRAEADAARANLGSATVVAEVEQVNKTIVLDKEDILSYTDGKKEITDAFRDMAPGDERTVILRVENQSEHSASFYLSQETTKALEETTTASGGAYSYKLSVGKSKEDATLLLDTIVGGYEDSANGLVGDQEGLANITELKDFVLLAELEKGAYANVYLTLAIDGEGFDSTEKIDYSSAVGELAFHFMAYYEDKANEEEDTGITQIVEQVVPLAAKTGDDLTLWPIVLLFAVGVALIFLAEKRKKQEESHEKM